MINGFSQMVISEKQYNKAVVLINSVHQQDPNSETVDGIEIKAELLYSRRMLSILKKVQPNASLELQLAAQCQHISRWSIPRVTFPIGKKGYYEWRAAIMKHQLSVTTSVLQQAEINGQSIEIIVDALKNKADKSNINASIIEDTACLTFIKWYLVPFAGQFDPEKAKVILQKTANKMSERGLKLISEIELSKDVLNVLSLLNK